MALKFMYITNNPAVAEIADANGVDRVWVDLETMGKEERQRGMNTVKSQHTMQDISVIRGVLNKAQLLVRVNPLYSGTKAEVDEAVARGADIVMLPMFRTADEAEQFVHIVAGRVKVLLLLETVDAERNIEEIVKVPGVDEIHIGLNDLHLEHRQKFLFEPLADGTVDRICAVIRKAGIPYGFGGLAKLDGGLLPGRMVLAEHYRIGSSMVILSRAFCDEKTITGSNFAETFASDLKAIRAYEKELSQKPETFFTDNQEKVAAAVREIVKGRSSTEDIIDSAQLKRLALRHGDAFYLLDTNRFRQNLCELKHAFSVIYPNFNIAYSYKTNYTPVLCRIVDEMGGYAEVVSDMEMDLALRIGVSPQRIIWNGPYKNPDKEEELLLLGGTVNLDAAPEAERVLAMARKYPQHIFRVGIRVNFDIQDGVVSRFGFDVESEDFRRVTAMLREQSNIHFVGIQCHFATRRLDTWRPRVEGMLRILDELGVVPDHIDLGGGLFGKMPDSLKAQFDSAVPSYEEYAKAVAPLFAERFTGEKKPLLLIEPGSAVVGDCMKFAAKVVSIKEVRGKAIATLLGSIYNINPTLNKKNPPISVYAMGGDRKKYSDLDFGGFTCIESDYLYRHFDGELAVGDMVVFGNAGSYSIVLKPPFILPNFPVVDMATDAMVKRAECFDDLFHTFRFAAVDAAAYA